MKRFTLTLDLIDNEEKIAAYERYHEAVWPEILQSIRDSGIEQMEIYRFGNRLFMIIDSSDEFTFEQKAAADAGNEKVQEWEKLMWDYQQALPGSKPGEKWMLMKEIFKLEKKK
ncbi:L-rhamnose mutarotase [Terrimonas sp. NA20]|uniref:L-rhamnose mutarotase n=1 Tax=Terrimonas ginsenosidimutans TaxID=2908004 RepID=A0ABS9KNA5_9BACT|nr:L-rhamnose mutarotase [Terrimonas ginsenosidimutans]MCG2613820.1 L-rhamnose mutarotase [Terrimonas ginsenosidimutans]